jgi:septal ring factor EnvC (AmiA/AmiB activator)
MRAIYALFTVIIFLTGCARTGYHESALKTAPASFDPGGFVWPAEGAARRPASDDAMKRKGIWISASGGGSVRASHDGAVAFLDTEFSGYGRTMILEHGADYATVYAGLGEILVAPGDKVRRGQRIATVDPGRNELYFELRKNAKAEDPLALLPGRASSSS